MVLVFGFITLTLISIYWPNWQDEYNNCLQRNDVATASCINEKREKHWQFNFLYKNGSIGNQRRDQQLKEQNLVE